jgi:hypothetical protein
MNQSKLFRITPLTTGSVDDKSTSCSQLHGIYWLLTIHLWVRAHFVQGYKARARANSWGPKMALGTIKSTRLILA